MCQPSAIRQGTELKISGALLELVIASYALRKVTHFNPCRLESPSSGGQSAFFG